MSTEETSTEETPMSMMELEKKIVRFNNLRSILIQNDKEWAEEHVAKRHELLEKAGILEDFKQLDEELKEHRASMKANVDPITASITILSEYRMACIKQQPFDNEEALKKVWVFEEQIFDGLAKRKNLDADAETEDHIEEKNEENSEE